MVRTFHSEVVWWYWLSMIMTAIPLFVLFWFHIIWAFVIAVLIMILEIEMLIHTRYVLTGDGLLRIESGRFFKKTTIDLATVYRIKRVRDILSAPALSVRRLEIRYKENGKRKKIQISPKGPEEFIRWISKTNNRIKIN